jgi:hypothetical protein
LDSSEAVSTYVSTPSSGNQINVADGSNFQPGDYIVVNGSLSRYVTGVSGNTLTLNDTIGSYTLGAMVNTAFLPTLAGTKLPSTTAIRLATFSQAIERRIHINPGDSTNIRLAFRHSAEYKKALTVQINDSLKGKDQPGGTLIDSAELTNKAMTDHTSPVITADKKYLQIDYTETPIATDGSHLPDETKSDTFADNLDPTNPYQTNTGDTTDVKAADNISLGDLYKQMLDKYTDPHWDYGNATGTPPTAATIIGTTVQNNIKHTFPTSSSSGNQWVDMDNIDNTTDPTLYHSDNAKHPRFYFMASVGNRKGFGAANPSSYPIHQTVFPTPSTTFIVPMATSVWLKLNGQQATLQGNQWDGTINNFYKVLQFGFSPLFINKDNGGSSIITGTAQNYADLEDALTADQYFYQPYGKEAINDDGYGSTSNYSLQMKYDSDAKYTLDSRLIADPSVIAGSNVLVLQLNDAQIGGHSLDYYFQNDYQIPFYRISNLKLQSEVTDDSSHELTQLNNGTTLDINAYVYAQEGSWCVIPTTYFDNDVKNNDDLNRDGVISPDESIAAYRYYRYNYQIVFTGAIMEDQTAQISDVNDWMEKCATVKMTVPTTAPTYNSADPANGNFDSVLYYYDPTAAVETPDNGFQIPITPGVEIVYQG